MFRRLIYFIISALLISCIQKNQLKIGTFELYEKGENIGTIYRLNKYQIEEYVNGEILYAKLIWKTDSSFILKGTELRPKKIDTVTFLNTIKRFENNKYHIYVTPFNVDSDYKYEAILIKKSNSIKKYLDTLIKLNTTR